MTLTLPRSQEKRARVTAPRTRTPSAQPQASLREASRQRADALAIAASARPSGKGVRQAREKLLRLAWGARLSGDWATWREIMVRVRELRGRTKAGGWKPTGTPGHELRRARQQGPEEHLQDADWRAHVDASRPSPATLRRQQRERALTRWRAGALVEALWGLAHGVRDWEALPTRPITATVHAPDAATTASVSTPQRLTVFVPALPTLGIEAHEIRLYRAEYEALLEQWGYAHLQKVNALTARLETVPGTKRDRAADELAELVIGAYVRQPAKALSWQSYLQAARLGAVFAYDPHRQDVRLAPRRSGDLRECALEIVALAEIVCVCS